MIIEMNGLALQDHPAGHFPSTIRSSVVPIIAEAEAGF